MSAPRPRRALLDTSILIDFPRNEVEALTDEVAVSAVTIAELQYGVAVAADPPPRCIDADVSRPCSSSSKCCPSTRLPQSSPELAALVHRRDPRPRRMDLQIAATAARHGLMLVTRNLEDFMGLESALEVVELPNMS